MVYLLEICVRGQPSQVTSQLLQFVVVLSFRCAIELESRDFDTLSRIKNEIPTL
jgi:hypothetical protein